MAGRRPYPGLRPFRRDEADLFFGRDDEIDALVLRLKANRFLGVLGASGSGKSSLVRTGLFEALEGGVGGLNSQWRIADCKPGGAPITRLAHALAAAANDSGSAGVPESIEAWLRKGPRAIIEWFRAGAIKPGWQLLILVDQFEELFNYDSLQGREDAHAYAALLTESISDPDIPIYVVLTMRSDYFGACGAYPELAEAISGSLFLTPRMRREECHDAILYPSRVIGFEIEDRLLNLILNDMESLSPFEGAQGGGQVQTGRQADQLPLMQYALNRIWLLAEARQGAKIRLTVDDYREIGGLAGALDAHGEVVIESVKAPEDAVEKVFRALVRGPSVALATRDPKPVSQISEIAGLPIATVVEVASAFSDDECLFLRVSRPIVPSSYVDINHESLIRQWGKLSAWCEVEAQDAEIWRYLSTSAAEWSNNKDPTALFRGLQLERRVRWMRENQPTPAWVARYRIEQDAAKSADLSTVTAFLAAGELARLSEESDLKRRRRGAQIAGLSALVGVMVAIAATASMQVRDARRLAEIQQERATQQAKAVILEMRNAETEKKLKTEALAREKNALEANVRVSAALQRELAASARATAASKDAQLALASMRRAIDERLHDMETNQGEIGAPVARSLDRAEELASLLGLKNNRSKPRDPERAARLITTASAIIARSAGADKRPEEVSATLTRLSDIVRTYSTDPRFIARSYFFDGKAAEMKQDYGAAGGLYARAFVVGQKAPEADGTAHDAATAMIRLHRRIGSNANSDNAADWCLQHGVTHADENPGGMISQSLCLASAAELRLDEGRDSEAQDALRAVEAISAAQPMFAPVGEKPAFAGSLADLQLKVLVANLNGRLSRAPSRLSDDVLSDARRHSNANSDTEDATSLYADALEGQRHYDRAIETRDALLRSTRATVGYRLDAMPALLAMEGGDNSVDDDNVDPRESDLLKAVERIKASILLAENLETLLDRRAPEIVFRDTRPELQRPRRELADQVIARLEKRLSAFNQALRAYADQDSLIADLEHADDTYVRPSDKRLIVSVLKIFAKYETACETKGKAAGSICKSYYAKAEEALRPIRLRFSSEKDDDAEAGVVLFDNALADQSLKDRKAPWLEGYDLVTYPAVASSDARLRPLRGRMSKAYDFLGRKLYFENDANLKAFTDDTARYLPAFGGVAVEWLKIGEARPGDPLSYCRIAGKLYLFDSASTVRAEWCGAAAKPEEVKARLKESEAAWRTLSPMSAGLIEPVVNFVPPVLDVAANEETDGLLRTYVLRQGVRVQAPAGGRLQWRTRNTFTIVHADGLVSEFRLSGGILALSGNTGPGAFVRRGGSIHWLQTGADHATLTWRVRRTGADGKLESMPLASVLREQTPATAP